MLNLAIYGTYLHYYIHYDVEIIFVPDIVLLGTGIKEVRNYNYYIFYYYDFLIGIHTGTKY